MKSDRSLAPTVPQPSKTPPTLRATSFSFTHPTTTRKSSAKFAANASRCAISSQITCDRATEVSWGLSAATAWGNSRSNLCWNFTQSASMELKIFTRVLMVTAVRPSRCSRNSKFIEWMCTRLKWIFWLTWRGNERLSYFNYCQIY